MRGVDPEIMEIGAFYENAVTCGKRRFANQIGTYAFSNPKIMEVDLRCLKEYYPNR